MKWHYPLMEYALEHGTLLEHKLLVPDGHGIEAQWTFAASFLYPAAGGTKPKTGTVGPSRTDPVQHA